MLATSAILLAATVTPGLTKPIAEPAESPLTAVLASIHLPKNNAPAATAARPEHIHGSLLMDGQPYTFGSGGYGRGSIPYGDFPVTPADVGSWGQRHGAIGINHNDIPDPKYRSHREGIELHPIGPQLRTEGCVGILAEQWEAFQRGLFGMIGSFGQAWLHVWPGGASITPSRVAPPANPLMALFGENAVASPVVYHVRRRQAAVHHHQRHEAEHHHHHRRYARNTK